MSNAENDWKYEANRRRKVCCEEWQRINCFEDSLIYCNKTEVAVITIAINALRINNNYRTELCIDDYSNGSTKCRYSYVLIALIVICGIISIIVVAVIMFCHFKWKAKRSSLTLSQPSEASKRKSKTISKKEMEEQNTNTSPLY